MPIQNPYIQTLSQGASASSNTARTASQFMNIASNLFNSSASLSMKMISLLEQAEARRQQQLLQNKQLELQARKIISDESFREKQLSQKQKQFEDSLNFDYLKLKQADDHFNKEYQLNKAYKLGMLDISKEKLNFNKNKLYLELNNNNKNDKFEAYKIALKNAPKTIEVIDSSTGLTKKIVNPEYIRLERNFEREFGLSEGQYDIDQYDQQQYNQSNIRSNSIKKNIDDYSLNIDTLLKPENKIVDNPEVEQTLPYTQTLAYNDKYQENKINNLLGLINSNDIEFSDKLSNVLKYGKLQNIDQDIINKYSNEFRDKIKYILDMNIPDNEKVKTIDSLSKKYKNFSKMLEISGLKEDYDILKKRTNNLKTNLNDYRKTLGSKEPSLVTNTVDPDNLIGENWFIHFVKKLPFIDKFSDNQVKALDEISRTNPELSLSFSVGSYLNDNRGLFTVIGNKIKKFFGFENNVDKAENISRESFKNGFYLPFIGSITTDRFDPIDNSLYESFKSGDRDARNIIYSIEKHLPQGYKYKTLVNLQEKASKGDKYALKQLQIINNKMFDDFSNKLTYINSEFLKSQIGSKFLKQKTINPNAVTNEVYRFLSKNYKRLGYKTKDEAITDYTLMSLFTLSKILKDNK